MSIFRATYLITIKELQWQHIHFHIKKKKKKLQSWTSLMVLWLRIHKLMHGTQVRSLVQSPRATQLPSWYSRACELQQLRPTRPRACAPRQEKPRQREATVKSSPRSPHLEKPMPSNSPSTAKKSIAF